MPLIGVVSVAAASGLLEATTDRDWMLRGSEWLEVFVVAALLAVVGARIVPAAAQRPPAGAGYRGSSKTHDSRTISQRPPLKTFVPLSTRTWVRKRQREWHRSIVLRHCISSLKRQPLGSAETWRKLVSAYGSSYAAEPEFLAAMAAAAVTQEGAILECGSGLTTLALATVTRSTGSPLWTLEHDPRWFRETTHALRRFGLDANVRFTPLRDCGDFDWYAIDPADLPTFSLVVCDGPPNWTRGGRFGLLPVLGDRLASGCVILLDDAARRGEREVLRLWESMVPLRYEIVGETERFAVVTLM